MSLHASLVLPRADATRLRELFIKTGNFPDTAETLECVLRAPGQPSVAIVTTASQITRMMEWLQGHYYLQKKPSEFSPILEAFQRALNFPFFEEHVNTSSSV